MKISKTTTPIYVLIALTIGLAIYYGAKADSLQDQLAKSKEQSADLARTIATNEALFKIDSLILNDDYSGALMAYQDQRTQMGTLENSRVELRIAMVNKFAALNEGMATHAKSRQEAVSIDSTDFLKAASQQRIRQVDSLNFAMEKAKVQLAHLKRNMAKKELGKYLTFKSTKGSVVHYVGNVKQEKANGQGLALLSTGSRYEGEWKDNLRHGEGTFFWSDGEYYIGGYKNDKRSGKGTYYWPNGEKFIGHWENDKRAGEGVFYSKDGKVISGIWSKDKLEEAYKKGKSKKAVPPATSIAVSTGSGQ